MITYTVTIFIAGDLAAAKVVLRRVCYEHGLCVTLTPTTFIYTGGEEAGVAVGLVDYPRYPEGPAALFERARNLARVLIVELFQKSALLVATDKTERLCIKPPGDRAPARGDE